MTRLAEQQQHVTRFQRERPHLLAEPLALSRHANQRDAITVHELYGHCGPAREPGRFRHEHLLQDQVFLVQPAPALANVLELQRTERLLNTVRTRLQNQDIARLDLGYAGQAGQALAVPHKPHDLHVEILDREGRAVPPGERGEITLSGNILPIGGVKEKVIAAKRVKVTRVILPKENEADFDELPDHVKDGVTPHFVSEFDDVLRIAFPEPAAEG